MKNVFYDILEGKNAFLGYRNKKFKKSKIDIFPKGLVQWPILDQNHGLTPTGDDGPQAMKEHMLEINPQNCGHFSVLNNEFNGTLKVSLTKGGYTRSLRMNQLISCCSL